MPERTAAEILARWRDLERGLVDVDPEDEAHPKLEIEIQRLRHDYQRAIADAATTPDEPLPASPHRSSGDLKGRTSVFISSRRK